MFYVAAKLFGFFLTLPNAAVFPVLFATAGLWTPWKRAFRTLATLAAAFLAICAFSPLTSVLLRPLEDRFPQAVLSGPPTGFIVLGGIVDEVTTLARGSVALTDGAERLTEAVALSRLYPTSRLVFSGGSAHTNPGPVTEAAAARRFWTEMGVPAERMEFEDRSRDTWENGVFTKDLLKPKPGETWVLVTSASHMPRAVGIFRKIGFPVVPYPVDYHTTGTPMDFRGIRSADTLAPLAIASHEWLGLVAYYFAGKTDALFPGP